MSRKMNKHGLKGYIPSPIREQIRKDAGYGCVMCGSLFVDYEHIEPEFNNAKKHDPDRMTLLCIGCHGTVTRGRRSKKAVWKAKESPKAKQQGFIKDWLFPPEAEIELQLGSSIFNLSNVILKAYGKPLFWFESPESEGEPVKVNAIFYDVNSNPIAFINRNQFIGLVGLNDITGEGSCITIRPKKGNIALELQAAGDEPIHILRLNMNYLNTNFEVTRSGAISIKQGNSVFNFDGVQVSGCGTAIQYGDIPETRTISASKTLSKISIATMIHRNNAKVIRAFDGTAVGWLLYSWIINKSYTITAIVKDRCQVHSIVGEYIGELHDSGMRLAIITPKDEYETGEPIWVNPNDRSSRNGRTQVGFDVCYRVANY